MLRYYPWHFCAVPDVSMDHSAVETAGTSHTMTWRHIPDDLNFIIPQTNNTSFSAEASSP
jgi:hypothetical protein